MVTERTPARREYFYATGELDTAYVAETIGRFRVNGFRQRGAISFASATSPGHPGLQEAGSPGRPRAPRRRAARARPCHRRDGLRQVDDARDHGRPINRTRKQHIVTIEDPIEIVHDNHGCIVNQREIGLDTESYGQALRRVLRQDPDVILIGELRDEESARAALQAAESGHLVLSTMHTIDAVETIGRFVEFFPAAKQMMVRQILAGVLRGAVGQRLLPKIGGGRVAAVEVMFNTARIADLIRDPLKTDRIEDAIAEGSYHLMQTFSQSLVQLVLGGLVDREAAANAAGNRHDFEIAIERALREKEVAEPPEAEGGENGFWSRGHAGGHLRLATS